MALDIPDAGLLLESCEAAMADLPTQAFAITLDDDVVEDLLASMDNGDGITLSLGSSPVSGRALVVPTLRPIVAAAPRQWPIPTVAARMQLLHRSSR